MQRERHERVCETKVSCDDERDDASFQLTHRWRTMAEAVSFYDGPEFPQGQYAALVRWGEGWVDTHTHTQVGAAQFQTGGYSASGFEEEPPLLEG